MSLIPAPQDPRSQTTATQSFAGVTANTTAKISVIGGKTSMVAVRINSDLTTFDIRQGPPQDPKKKAINLEKLKPSFSIQGLQKGDHVIIEFNDQGKAIKARKANEVDLNNIRKFAQNLEEVGGVIAICDAKAKSMWVTVKDKKTGEEQHITLHDGHALVQHCSEMRATKAEQAQAQIKSQADSANKATLPPGPAATPPSKLTRSQSLPAG